ncbi:MAG: glycosyltransferase family 4 protein [Roseiflexus sp.]|nr:glycosyltransferase family 4 protein [Roseiflexus sp.]MCS7289791.1 glycosyltransferase family 4 protein [Roseiflexus sp.]MDW8145726.1 glycosyltransferase family 4 protein [Roseiflexaceae bacterium]MDW8232494.1 glycosyltransferase family 4 protein [Roseiflexaceae bacterium]
MPRLLIVTTVPATISAFLLPFARHYRACGWQVDAMTRNEAIDPEMRAAFDHIWTLPWSRQPFSPANLIGTPQRIRQIVEREQYDIVHVHTSVAAFVTRYALRNVRRRTGVRVIYTAHGFNFDQSMPWHKNLAFLALEKLASAWMDYQVVINRTDEQAAIRYRLAPPERVWYMPGIGVDLTRYSPNSVTEAEVAALRRSMGVAPDEALFLMIAEFIPRKRHADALRAFARLERDDAHLALAGDGPLLEPMRRLAVDLGIAGRTHFLGYRRDIPALLRAATALVLPSRQEGLPRSILEALALGVPVIGSDIRGVRDLLEEGAGLLVPVGDIAGLAYAMRRMIDDREAARTMAERGLEQAKRYDLQRIIALHDQLYAAALSERRVPAPTI